MCSQGYVIMRVDMRGTGNSTGLYFDEYAKQEQDDACEIIGSLFLSFRRKDVLCLVTHMVIKGFVRYFRNLKFAIHIIVPID